MRDFDIDYLIQKEIIQGNMKFPVSRDKFMKMAEFLKSIQPKRKIIGRIVKKRADVGDVFHEYNI